MNTISSDLRKQPADRTYLDWRNYEDSNGEFSITAELSFDKHIQRLIKFRKRCFKQQDIFTENGSVLAEPIWYSARMGLFL